jgi:hypothetical protein
LAYNQQRNDAVERIDDLILQALVSKLNSEAPIPFGNSRHDDGSALHSGAQDKAMYDQTIRTDVEPTHLVLCDEKLARLKCNAAIWRTVSIDCWNDYAAGRAR